MRRIAVVLVALLGAQGCRSAAVLMMVQEQHPPNATVEVQAVVKGAPGNYLTEVWIRNISGVDVLVGPESFALRDEAGIPYRMMGVTHFRELMPTRDGRRSLGPGRQTFGQMRWVARSRALSVYLLLNVAGEEHWFQFSWPTRGRPVYTGPMRR